MWWAAFGRSDPQERPVRYWANIAFNSTIALAFTIAALKELTKSN